MGKIIYKILNLYLVCEITIQIVTTSKDYEYKIQFYGCGFFIMNKKIQLRINCQKYVTGSQASSMEQREHQFLKLRMH